MRGSPPDQRGAENRHMSATGPVNPAATGRPPGSGPGGSLAALAGVVLRAPFTGRAWRELLFCAIEVPLGLCALVFPIALVALPSAVALLSSGGPLSARPGGAPPAGLVAALGGLTVLVLLALLFLAGRIGRRLGAAHRRLAARLLGEDIPGPPPIRRGGGVAGWLAATARDGPGWKAAAYLLVKL